MSYSIKTRTLTIGRLFDVFREDDEDTARLPEPTYEGHTHDSWECPQNLYLGTIERVREDEFLLRFRNHPTKTRRVGPKYQVTHRAYTR